MPRTGQKVTVGGGGGVESEFSFQLRPKLNKNPILILITVQSVAPVGLGHNYLQIDQQGNNYIPFESFP